MGVRGYPGLVRYRRTGVFWFRRGIPRELRDGLRDPETGAARTEVGINLGPRSLTRR
jgi:hypothetical protein